MIVAEVSMDHIDAFWGEDVISEASLHLSSIVVLVVFTIIGIPVDVDVVDVDDNRLDLW